MPEIAYNAQVDALDALLGRVVEVGLARANPDDEEDDPNYKRQRIVFGSPRREVDGRVVRASMGIVRFPAYAMTGVAAVSWWALYDARGDWEEPFFPDGFLKVWIP